MTGRAPLALVMDPREAGVPLLSDSAEQDRSELFANPADARAFLVSRTLTRVVAGAFRGSPASDVLIHRRCARCGGPHGRPTAVGDPAGLSSSRRRVIVAAVAAEDPVAIDVEPLVAGRDVPDAYLTTSEKGANPTPFGRLMLWTRKECLVKLGHCELDDFQSVTAGPGHERVAVVDGVRFYSSVLLGAVVTIASVARSVPAVHVIGGDELSRLAASRPEQT